MASSSPPAPPPPTGLPPGAGGPEDLLAGHHDLDAVIDLTGLGEVAALAVVEQGLQAGAAAGHARIWFRFPRADGSGSVTLFQPVGRALKAALAAGRLVRAMPGAEGGWIARLAGADRP